MINLSAIAFDALASLPADPKTTVSRSRVLEVAAALLGYGTYAAYLADLKAGGGLHEDADHIVLQPAYASHRAAGLGMSNKVVGRLIHAVRQGVETANASGAHAPRIHDSYEAFRDSVLWEELSDAVSSSQEVMDAFAETNAYEEDSPDLEDIEDVGPSLLKAVAGWSVVGTGSITGTPDPDRPYHGHEVDFTITRHYEKVGRVGIVFVEDEVSAWLKDDWRGDD